MIEFTLFGIPVRIQIWFWVTMALIGGVTSADTRDEIIGLLFFMAAGFVSILIHELGHAVAGKCYGARPAITLQAFGGYAEFPGKRFTRLQDFVVTMAGPAIQFICGIATLLVMAFINVQSRWGHDFLEWFTSVSLFWAVINLVPVLPLDGGRLLNALLGPQRLKTTLIVSMVTAILAAIGMFAFLKTIFFPIFLASFAWQNWQMLQQLNQSRFGPPSDRDW